jgi:hypothetical protein
VLSALSFCAASECNAVEHDSKGRSREPFGRLKTLVFTYDAHTLHEPIPKAVIVASSTRMKPKLFSMPSGSRRSCIAAFILVEYFDASGRS